MRAFAHHFSFEFHSGLRDKNQMLMNYLFPLSVYALLSLLMTQVNPLFKDTMIPAMTVFALLGSMLLGLPGPHVEAREAGVFRSYKINGVPAISILAIPALATALHMVLVAAIIALTAPLLFGGRAPSDWLGFGLVFLAVTFACAGLGLLIGVISGNSRSTVLWSQLIFLPSMIVGGMMIPTSMLPAAIGRIAWLLPAAQAMNAFQGLAMGLPGAIRPMLSVGILALGGVMAFVLAAYLFNWDSRSDARRGRRLLALLALLPYVIGMVLLA
jgi:ABC-2 type transport system permease protein